MSLVGWWPLDGTTESRIGPSGSNPSVTYVDGKIGQGIDCDGSQIRVSSDNEGIKSAFTGNQMTLAFWLREYDHDVGYPDIFGFDGTRFERAKDVGNTAGDYWCNLGTGDSAISGRENNVLNDDIGQPGNEWFHVAIRRKGDDYAVYINGERDTSCPVTGPMQISGDFIINEDSAGAEIDDVRLYDHALSEKQIAQLSQAKVLHYKFDQGLTTNTYTLESGAIPPEWNNINGSIKSDESISGDYSFGSDNEGGVRADIYPNELDGGKQIDEFEYYWWEETNQSGHRITLYDSSGNEVQYSETENPQWILSDGTGENTIRGYDGQGYQNWTRFSFDFDWENGTYNYLLEDENNEYVSTGTQNLNNVTDVEMIRIHSPTGSGNYNRFDNILYSYTPDVGDSSGNGNTGVNNGATFVEDSKIGSGAYDFSSSSGVVAQNDPTLQVTTDLTIAFWAKPFDISSARQNPVHKDYTHEYTMTAETDGNLSFYFNDSDSSYNNYQANNMFRNDNEWVHVTVVRKNGDGVYWYRNGEEYDVQGWDGGDPVAGNNDVIIGDGYTNPYNGILDDFRIYASALSAEEVQELYQQRASVDSCGNIHTTEIVETAHRGRIADYTEWDLGTSGSQGSFSQNGSTSENEIVEYTDPFGKKVPTWKCIPESDDGADGGWNKSFTGDNSQRLRFSVFVKRTGSSMNGSYYHGCDNGGNTLNLDGSTNGNPYFHSGNLPSTNTWYLLVGILHPNNYGGGQTGISGVYDLNGNQVSGGTDYKWGPDNNQEMRNYLYYSTDTSERQYFVYPRVDVLDGNAPSISALTGGIDSRVYDHISNINTSKPQPLAVQPENAYISTVNEVGPAPNALVGWWPLDGDVRDRSGNGYDAKIRGSPTFTSGVVGNVMDFNESNGDYLPIKGNYYENTEALPEITISAWVKTTGDNQYIIQYDRSEFFRSTTDVWVTHAEGEGTSDMGYSGAQDGNWHHVVHWYNANASGTEKRVYIDGTLQKELDSPHNGVALGSNLTTYGAIAAFGESRSFNGDDSARMTGQMKDIRFYDRALTQQEVQTLYNLTDPRQKQQVIQSETGELYTKGEFMETL